MLQILLATTFFFVFVTTSCIGFTQTEKNYVKVIDDDICNMVIEFKAKNKILTDRNYSNVDKKYGELYTFMSIMLITKITLDM